MTSDPHRELNEIIGALDVLLTLREEFAQLKRVYGEALENTPDGPNKARVAAECDRLVEETEELLAAEIAEKLQIYMNNKKLMLLTKQLGGALSPPKAEVDEMFEEARGLLPEAIRMIARGRVAVDREGGRVVAIGPDPADLDRP